MNKIKSNNKITALEKEKRKTVLKRYLMIAITVAIVCVAMVPVVVGYYLRHHQGYRRYPRRLGPCSGRHELPEPRSVPAFSGFPLPCRWSHHRLCKVDPDCNRSRRIQLI